MTAVVRRCQEEQRDLARYCTPPTKSRSAQAKRDALAAPAKSSDPVRFCLFGIPGAGKSHCIKLLQEFFESCLEWEDGVQFKFLASQNTMAALIGGVTIHSWAKIPIDATEASSKTKTTGRGGDVDELFLKAAGIRWLLIDETSTVSPGSRAYWTPT